MEAPCIKILVERCKKLSKETGLGIIASKIILEKNDWCIEKSLEFINDNNDYINYQFRRKTI